MKTIKYILLFAAAACLFSACSDFLEPKPRSSYTEMDAWASPENTYLYINGFYKPIYDMAYGLKYAGVSLHDGTGYSPLQRQRDGRIGQRCQQGGLYR